MSTDRTLLQNHEKHPKNQTNFFLKKPKETNFKFHKKQINFSKAMKWNKKNIIHQKKENCQQ